jgi:hypothetical protein
MLLDGRADVDRATQQLRQGILEVLKDAEVREAHLIGGQIDEEVDIAVRPGVSSGHRPEHADVGRSVLGGDREDVLAHRPQPLQRQSLPIGSVGELAAGLKIRLAHTHDPTPLAGLPALRARVPSGNPRALTERSTRTPSSPPLRSRRSGQRRPDDRAGLLTALRSSSLEEKRDTAHILFLLSTGVRIAEALRLDRRDWRPDRMTVVGKGDRERPVVITARCREATENYLAGRSDPSPALFIGFHRLTQARHPRDNRLTADGARYICRQLAHQLGLERFSPHVLRHTLGTLLQEEMGDARLTAEVLGHSGLGSVAGYTKVAATHLREGYRRMESRGL